MKPTGRPLDTSEDAHRHQRQIYAQMSGSERLSIAFQLTDTARRLTMAGIRARHPEYSDDDVFIAYARLTLGDDLVRAVWPDRALVAP